MYRCSSCGSIHTCAARRMPLRMPLLGKPLLCMPLLQMPLLRMPLLCVHLHMCVHLRVCLLRLRLRFGGLPHHAGSERARSAG